MKSALKLADALYWGAFDWGAYDCGAFDWGAFDWGAYDRVKWALMTGELLSV